jgi:hypothetical protein
MAPANGSAVTLESDIFRCCREVKTLQWADDKTAKQLLTRKFFFAVPSVALVPWEQPNTLLIPSLLCVLTISSFHYELSAIQVLRNMSNL